jgi:hypothetical protein
MRVDEHNNLRVPPDATYPPGLAFRVVLRAGIHQVNVLTKARSPRAARKETLLRDASQGGEEGTVGEKLWTLISQKSGSNIGRCHLAPWVAVTGPYLHKPSGPLSLEPLFVIPINCMG